MAKKRRNGNGHPQNGRTIHPEVQPELANGYGLSKDKAAVEVEAASDGPKLSCEQLQAEMRRRSVMRAAVTAGAQLEDYIESCINKSGTRPKMTDPRYLALKERYEEAEAASKAAEATRYQPNATA